MTKNEYEKELIRLNSMKKKAKKFKTSEYDDDIWYLELKLLRHSNKEFDYSKPRPLKVVKKYIQELNMSAKEMSKELGMREHIFNNYLTEKVRVTPEFIDIIYGFDFEALKK